MPRLQPISSNAAAYDYPIESIMAWPDQATLATMMRKVGWRRVQWKNLVRRDRRAAPRMGCVTPADQAVVLDAYAAIRCPVKVQNYYDATIRLPEGSSGYGVRQQRCTAGTFWRP